ncbi:MAG: indolepyruvate oxidoreductase subunit beta [Candidatus Nealsonbacteria bacterium]|nr:indolepyruvate oxidoreductase subunit beta [Candidatus Nealsonbacteria bacterium]
MKDFNLIVNGVGGQGLVTLLKIVAEAAQIEGFDVRASELHGLSQRGGSVEVYIRFGQVIYSPLVAQGKADLVISLEEQEALNGLYFANQKTVFLANKYRTPTFLKDVPEEEVLAEVKKVSPNVFLIPANEVCLKEFKTDVVSGIYLLGQALAKGCLPLKKESLILAFKKIIPEQYLELNLKAFDLAQS